MKILITGGCGFLGTNLANAILTKKEDELIIFDDLSKKGSEINLEWLRSIGNFRFYKSDIRIKEDIGKAIRESKPEAILHLAGQVAMTTSIEDPRLDFEINALGTLNLLESIRTLSPKSIVVYSSTNKVYGDLEWVKYEEKEKRYIAPQFPNGFPENIPLDFHSPYGCSKGAADQYVLDYHRMFGLRTAVFRHSSMYGGRQFSTYDQGWIGWFCQQALETKSGKLKTPFTISGTGKQVRDVLYAEDIISLYFSAIKNIEKINGRAFNIGGGMANSLSLLELFDILEKEVGVKLSCTKLPWRSSDQKIFVADIRKYSSLTGWAPKTDKINGIKKMLQWVKENE